LIGLEREYVQQKEDTPDFAGIRTFTLISLLGAITAFLETDFGMLPFALGFGGVILLSAINFVTKQIRGLGEGGTTTEVAVILTFLFGATAYWNQLLVAGALAVVTALLLSLKKGLHGAIRHLKGRDLRAALQFALLSVVILPILPNHTIDPLGVINPFRIWLLVVFISGIGFAGYLFMKILGAETGTWLTGIFGGIISSTATTLSFSSRSKEAPKFANKFAVAILLASAVMPVRMFVVVGVIYPPLLRIIAIPLAVMLVSNVAMVYYYWQRFVQNGETEKKAIKITNPLRLTTALLYGLAFALVLVIVNLADKYLGTAGVYVTGFVTGIADVNPIMLSASQLASTGQLAVQIAGTAIVIAALTNTISKGLIAFVMGSSDMRPIIIPTFAVSIVLGGIALALVLLL
jgi:uncharacterized membrane protein (DUF4010 family)